MAWIFRKLYKISIKQNMPIKFLMNWSPNPALRWKKLHTGNRTWKLKQNMSLEMIMSLVHFTSKQLIFLSSPLFSK
jgi:hypothetical protein